MMSKEELRSLCGARLPSTSFAFVANRQAFGKEFSVPFGIAPKRDPKDRSLIGGRIAVSNGPTLGEDMQRAVQNFPIAAKECRSQVAEAALKWRRCEMKTV